MKKVKILFGIIAIICLAIGFSSCKKEKTPQDKETRLEYTPGVPVDFKELPEDVLKIINSDSGDKATEYFRSTTYNSEIVEDPGSLYVWYIRYYQGTKTPCVKCWTPNHQVVLYPLTYNSNNDIWYLGMSLPMQGHYVWRYTDIDTVNLTNWNTYIDNTYVRFNANGTSSLVWPFGYEDNSSYTSQGLWTMNCGPGCYMHTGTSYYAYDWNWNISNPYSDNGKILCSPVDGFVTVSSYVNDIGTAWQILVDQEYGTQTYRHAFCHIQSNTIVPSGTYVKTGDPIARIGSTGADSPHAHCQLKLVGASSTIPMEYDAQ